MFNRIQASRGHKSTVKVYNVKRLSLALLAFDQEEVEHVRHCSRAAASGIPPAASRYGSMCVWLQVRVSICQGNTYVFLSREKMPWTEWMYRTIQKYESILRGVNSWRKVNGTVIARSMDRFSISL